MKAFYFAADNKKLRYGDERKIKVGLTHTVNCEPILCKAGLHASTRLIDALNYAPDSHLYLVELGGKIVHGDDKAVATDRTYIAEFNAEKLLQEFARKQALINIEKIRDYCSEEDYILIVRWLKYGNPDDQGSCWSAAKSAVKSAESAARSAAKSAESAARASAKSAESAAWSAAESAWSAETIAAFSATRAAARAAAESVKSVAESAAWSAWSAARFAAESVAKSAADKMLTEMVKKETGWDI